MVLSNATRQVLMAGKTPEEQRRIQTMRNNMMWHLNNVSIAFYKLISNSHLQPYLHDEAPQQCQRCALFKLIANMQCSFV